MSKARQTRKRPTHKGRLAKLRRKAKAGGWANYIRTEADERALLAGCYVDTNQGQHVVNFFAEYLRHSKGEWAGQPFILAPVQVTDIIMPAYSWLQPDGRRRFKTIIIFVAKKNFKSTLAAGLSLYGLVGDGEAGAEVYNIANDRDQAAIVFRQSADMVDSSPSLSSKLVVTRSNKTISYGTNAWQRALSADVSSAEGRNGSTIVIDEIHKFDDRGRLLFEAMKYSGVARRQPLNVIISTAGDDDTGIGYETYQHAKAILAGVSDDVTTFAYIAEAAEGDKLDSPATWAKANPMMGITIQKSEMRESYEEAKDSPRKLAVFKRYRLNIWTKTSEPWLNMGHWDACNEPFSAEDMEGMECAGGIDLATKSDLSAVALCFPDDVDADRPEFYSFLLHFWLPDDNILKREEQDRCPYRQWADEGWLTLTEGNTTKFDAIRDYVVDASQRYALTECGFDPWNAHQMAQELQDRHGLCMIEMRQGIPTLAAPSKAFENLVTEHRIAHGGNPILRTQASHVCVDTDTNGNFRPVKMKAKKFHRIDGIMASVMALGRALSMAEGETVIDSGGFVV